MTSVQFLYPGLQLFPSLQRWNPCSVGPVSHKTTRSAQRCQPGHIIVHSFRQSRQKTYTSRMSRPDEKFKVITLDLSAVTVTLVISITSHKTRALSVHFPQSGTSSEGNKTQPRPDLHKAPVSRRALHAGARISVIIAPMMIYSLLRRTL